MVTWLVPVKSTVKNPVVFAVVMRVRFGPEPTISRLSLPSAAKTAGSVKVIGPTSTRSGLPSDALVFTAVSRFGCATLPPLFGQVSEYPGTQKVVA